MSSFSHSRNRPRIAVVGAGIIGLAIAWRLVQREARIQVFHDAPLQHSASHAAAGMLAPAFECASEPELPGVYVSFCIEAAKRWATFASELERETGCPVFYQSGPSLLVAGPELSLAALEKAAGFLSEEGLDAARLSGETLARFEPALSDTVTNGLVLGTDGQVDNRGVLSALVEALRQRGATFERRAVEPGDPVLIGFDQIIWARGERETLAGAGAIKGQAISFAPFAGMPHHVIRSGGRYIVPKPDRVIIGATSETGFSHRGTDAQALRALRLWGERTVPALRFARGLEAWSGFRPASADRLPVIGSVAPGEIVAGAHYRNGILLAPLTAELVSTLALEGQSGAIPAIFTPQRLNAALP